MVEQAIRQRVDNGGAVADDAQAGGSRKRIARAVSVR
jgi:hypothetical protein